MALFYSLVIKAASLILLVFMWSVFSLCSFLINCCPCLLFLFLFPNTPHAPFVSFKKYGSHAWEKTCYVCLWVCFISLNMIVSSADHLPTNDIILFFFVTVQNSTVNTDHILFIHSSFDRHLGWFHDMEIVSSALMRHGWAGVSIVCWLTFLHIWIQEQYGWIIW
jgi:hypothetical protein